MYSTSPSEEAIAKAMEIVRIELMHVQEDEAVSSTLGEDELRMWTQKVLDSCYSIGASYDAETIRKVVRALIRRHLNC